MTRGITKRRSTKMMKLVLALALSGAAAFAPTSMRSAPKTVRAPRPQVEVARL